MVFYLVGIKNTDPWKLVVGVLFENYETKGEKSMNMIPSRDITGKCEGECRDRVFEGEQERQIAINRSRKGYDTPAEWSPSWTSERNDPPGVMGGRI